MNLQDINYHLQKILRSGATSRNLMVVATNIRRMHIEKKLVHYFNGLIQDGIFKGLKISLNTHDSVLIPKLLGTYEIEIANHIRSLTEQSKVFVDVGCADGYYTSGIAASTGIEKVVGVDISCEALELATESARNNELEHKCIFVNDIDLALPHIENETFVMVDVDGAEKKVLHKLGTYIKSNQLRKIRILIETDFNSDGSPNKQELLDELNRLGFIIKHVIKCDPLCKSRFSPIASKLFPSYLDQMICALERGKSNQSWIIAVTDTSNVEHYRN